jgi:alpha-N-arabinofuranosidase
MFHKNIAILICILMTGNFSFAQNTFYIKDSAIAAKPVSPLLYSSFLELGWGRSTDNMWADLLYNRSFEENEAKFGEYAGGGLVKDVKVANENWWHSGYEAAKWYLHKEEGDKESNMKTFDDTWPLPGNGKRSMQLFNKSTDKDILFCQDSIFLHKNVSYQFEGLINNFQEFTADSITKKTITISICLFKEGDFSKPLSEKDVVINTGYFHNYKAILPDFNYEGRGTFAIKIHSGNKLNVDLLSLMPADNIMGWRKDVIAAMRDSVPVGTIRFPGGCFASTYLWRDGIGDRQNRKMIFDALSDGGSDVVHDVGTVEFLNLCKLTKAVPVLDVAVMLNTADYAADWVAFCNAPTNALRKSVGYTNPFNVKYWELDNEPYRKFDAITYAHKCVEFSKAMKKVDPTIKLIMGNYFIYGPKLNEMLEIAGQYIDVINKREDLPFEEYQKTLDIINAYNKIHATQITMCDTETTFPSKADNNNGSVDGLNHQIGDDKTSVLNKAVRWAHGMSGIKNYIKFQNLGGDFIFANYWAYVNSYGENLLNVTKENVFVSAPGKAYRFMELTNLSVPVKVISAADKDVLVQAGWSKEKNKFIVIVLNYTDQTLSRNFDLTQLHIKSLKCNNSYSVFAKNMDDFNSPEHPDMIKSETSRSDINGMKFSLTAKPNSATYWEFNVLR